MKGSRTSNSGKGFTNSGWEKIQEFNKRAADPSDSEVNYTYVNNPQLASENGKKRKGYVTPSHVKHRMSITHKLRHLKRRIANGESVSDEDLAWAQNIISNANDAQLDIQATIQDLESVVEEIDDPVDRAKALAIIVHNKREAFKLNHQNNEETIKRVLDVDSLNKALLDRQKEREN